MYLVVYSHPVLGDGRGANKPWLQEIPDPVTKIIWQTVVEMNPVTAEKMGLDNGDLVTVTTTCRLALRSRSTAISEFSRTRSRSLRDAATSTLADTRRLATTRMISFRSPKIAPAESRSFRRKRNVTKAGGTHVVATTEGSARQHRARYWQAIAIADLGELGRRCMNTEHEKPEEREQTAR